MAFRDRDRPHRSLALLAACLVAAPVAAQGPLEGQEPPAVLGITIERIKPASEARYDAIEREAAAVCRRLGCPNAYLALESFTAPKEVYWLTAYRSEADVDRVAAAYAGNEPLRAELRRVSAAKDGIVEPPVNLTARYRPELSDASPWLVGILPFAVIVEGNTVGSGAVFELADGRQLVFIPAANAEDTNAIAAAFGAGAKRFAVRAEWSKPAAAWIIANPALWPPTPR
jgi:hypothetical protein